MTTPMAAPAPDPWETAVLRRVPLEILAAAAALGLATALVFGPLHGLSVLAGGAVAALGFAGMRKGLDRVLARRGARALRSGLGLFGLRLVLILLILSLIIFTLPRELPAFAAGFSAVLPVVLLEAFRALARSRAWKS
jgi:hypothetical protein